MTTRHWGEIMTAGTAALLFVVAAESFILAVAAIRSWVGRCDSEAYYRAALASARSEPGKWISDSCYPYRFSHKAFGTLRDNKIGIVFDLCSLGGCEITRRQYKNLRRTILDALAVKEIRKQADSFSKSAEL